MKWINVCIGDFTKEQLKHIDKYLKSYVFECWLGANDRERTGYKELADLGVEWEDVRSVIGNPSPTGGYKFSKINYVRIGGSRNRKDYWLNPAVFDEADIYKVLLTRDPEYLWTKEQMLWFDPALFAVLPDNLRCSFIRKIKEIKLSCPANEILELYVDHYRAGDYTEIKGWLDYDEEKFNMLSEPLQKWFKNKIAKWELNVPAAELLNLTLDKYGICDHKDNL